VDERTVEPAGKENAALTMQAGPPASRRSGEGGATLQVQAVMRSAYQGGWGSLLVGFCYGGKEPAMAGFTVISQHRDGRLIGGLLIRVRACGPVEKILLW
jgi:hypothetical protein